MQCASCGAEAKERDHFCTSCGAPLERVPEPDPGAAEAAGPATQTSLGTGWASASTSDPAESAPSSLTRPLDDQPRLGGWILPVFLFGWIAGAIGWFSLRRSDRPRANHVLKWGVIWSVVFAIVVPAIWLGVLASVLNGSDELTSDPGFVAEPEPDPGLTDFSETGFAEPATPLDAPVVVKELTGTTSDGYSGRLTVSVYDVARGDAVPSLPSGRAWMAACSLDPLVDAVVPIHLTLENTTDSFPAPLGVELIPMFLDDNDYDSAVLMTFEGDVEYASGSACNGPATATSARGYILSIVWNDPVDPGGLVDTELYLVLHDYYTPNTPDGDIARLEGIVLQPVLKFGPEGSRSETSTEEIVPLVSGPSTDDPEPPGTSTVIDQGGSGISRYDDTYFAEVLMVDRDELSFTVSFSAQGLDDLAAPDLSCVEVDGIAMSAETVDLTTAEPGRYEGTLTFPISGPGEYVFVYGCHTGYSGVPLFTVS